MRFGPVPTTDAEGAILAHSLNVDGTRLKKGRRLSAADLAVLTAAGIPEVVAAQLEPGDVDEDAAAEMVAATLAPEAAALGLTVSAPFTGRVNLFAATAGIIRVDRAAVDALNAVDPAVTLATLADWSRVVPRQMVATVKIIPYAVGGATLARACGAVGPGTLGITAFRPATASLILSRTPGFKESLLVKGRETIATRLAALGQTLEPSPQVVEHETEAVRDAFAAAEGDVVLFLGASATSDAADVGPAALVAAGGKLERLGMPVDPGNLLFLGSLGGRPVVGLPGCIRAPALNGADWVLERIAAGLDVTGSDIARMGVGGLLKEIPTRTQPRAGAGTANLRSSPRVSALLLAAGAARRMRGRDKLLEPLQDGRPVLRHAAEAALASQAAEVVVVLPPNAETRRATLPATGLRIVEASDWAEGMAASLRAGLTAVDAEADAVVILLADMPEVGARDIDRLMAAFDPESGRDICRAVAENGGPGHPVLIGRRFFETLAGLTGDRGAREVLREASEFGTEVPTPGRGAVIDLDTPEDWAAWRAGGPSG